MWPSFFVALYLGCAPGVAIAAPLALDVLGNVGHTNDTGRSAWHLNETDLLGLPTHEIKTSTRWTPEAIFKGPLLADVLLAAGARGDHVELRTLDDYTYTIPVDEAIKYGAILAYSMNGERLKASNFGPLFLVYPRDRYPERFTGPVGDAKFVWQVNALVVK